MWNVEVLVTGASGYLGPAVVRALEEAGQHVRRFGGDILDPGAIAPAVTGVDAVIHLAARGRARESFSDPIGYFQVNVTGTLNLLAAVPPGTRFIFASSAGVYGDPARQPIAESCPLAPKTAATRPVEAAHSTADSAAALLAA